MEELHQLRTLSSADAFSNPQEPYLAECCSRHSLRAASRDPSIRPDSILAPERSLIDRPPTQTRPDGKLSKVETLCKSLGLALFYNWVKRLTGRKTFEEPKVAMRKNRWHAFFRCTIHLLPVTAALLLVSLNAAQYYIGGELAGWSGQDTQKLAALQFAAKLHELLMLASVTTVLFSYVRRELAFGDGVPFGAIFGGLQVNSIAFLWSVEFWAVMYAKWSKRHKKATLITLLIVCTLLGVSVGPSTAVLMRPRLEDWPAGGTTFWLDAKDDVLSPNRMTASQALAHCLTDTGDASCPYGDWNLISDSVFSYWPRLQPMDTMPKSTHVSGKHGVRQLDFTHRTTDNGYTAAFYSNARTIATVPPVAVSDAVAQLGVLWAYAAANYKGARRLRYRNDNSFTVLATQPLVEARCALNGSAVTTINGAEFWFPNLNSILVEGADSTSRYSDVGNWTTDTFTGDDVAKFEKYLQAGSPANLIWFDDPNLRSMTHSVANAVAFLPSIEGGNTNVICCSIDARTTVSTVGTSRLEDKFVTGVPAYDYIDKGLQESNLPIISIDAEWAEYLVPTIAGQNQTIFAQIAQSAGIWNATIATDSYNYEFAMESILATLTANGIARASYDVTTAGTLRGSDTTYSDDPWGFYSPNTWTMSMIPKKNIGWGGDAYEITPAEAAQSTQFTMHATDNGYAYSYTGISQQAAMAVLLFYCTLALAHLFYAMGTGWTSTAWDSAPEIAALAIQSEKSRKLENTGAGIVTTEVFEERVRIRDKDGRLEYVFSDTEGGWKVRKNAVYG